MSVETITIVLSALGIVLTLGTGLFAGFSWVVRRMDAIDAKAVARDEALRLEFTGGFGVLRTEMKTDIAELRTEIGEVRRELTEVKVSVARWEGPPRNFALAR